MRPGADDAIPKALVKGEGGQIIHGGFKADGLGPCGSQALLGRSQQERSHPGSACRFQYVDGDDVAGHSALGDQKSAQTVMISPGIRSGVGPNIRRNISRNQGKRPPPAHISPEFLLGIGNLGSKALLVNPPQGLELFRF